jgi:hypothetical protein
VTIIITATTTTSSSMVKPSIRLSRFGDFLDSVIMVNGFFLSECVPVPLN